MNIDFIRGGASILGAVAIVIIALLALIWFTATKVIEPALGVTSIVGIAGPAAAFLWQAESAKQAAKQARSDLLVQPPEPPPAP